jgi:hypothetical protein
MFQMDINAIVVDARRPERGRLFQLTMPCPPKPSSLQPGRMIEIDKVVKYWFDAA